MATRRQFLKIGLVAVAGAGILLPGRHTFASVQVPPTPLPGAKIPQFVDALPTFVGRRVTGTFVTVDMREFQQKVLPESVYSELEVPYSAGTYVWGYKVGCRPAFFPGYTIEVQRGTPMKITYVNSLPLPNGSTLEPLLTIDQTIHWADPLYQMSMSNR